MTNLDPHIVRNLIVLDQATNKLEVRVTSSRICDLDLLHATFYELPKEEGLLLDSHGVGQCLISIPQIGRQPNRNLCERLRRPLAILKVYRGVRLVLSRWIRPMEVYEIRMCIVKD
jgi:hypothetical protein